VPQPYTIAHLGVIKDYDYSATHKRERLTLWTGPFASVLEGEAYSLPNGDGYMITVDPGGEKVRVACPTPRDDANYVAIDEALRVALNEHYAARHVTTLAKPEPEPVPVYREAVPVPVSETLYRALVVLTEHPRHVERLEEIDPKGLEQAYHARYAYVTETWRTRKPGLDSLSDANELERLRACIAALPNSTVPEPPTR
jgi:hypothetical protein